MKVEEEVITLRPRPAALRWGIGGERESQQQRKANFAGERYHHPSSEVDKGCPPDAHLPSTKGADYDSQFVFRPVKMHSVAHRIHAHPAGRQFPPSVPSGISNQSIVVYIRTEKANDEQDEFLHTLKSQPQERIQDPYRFCESKYGRFNTSDRLSSCKEPGSVKNSNDSKAVCEVVLNVPIQTMPSSPRLVVGCAINAKKAESFLKPTLLAHARSRGIVISAIDHEKPLSEQGSFDVILHKISGQAWHLQLKAYKKNNPNTCIFDPPKSIMKVYNRMSMLKEVVDLKFQHSLGKVDVPKQLVVDVDSSSLPDVVAKAKLRYPLVAKPLVIDGSAKSHALSLVFNESGLSTLSTPLVLQEFVSHGGVMFKVFVVGHLIKTIHRPSLLDACGEDTTGDGVMPFPRISSSSALSGEANPMLKSIEYPPVEMLSSFAMKLSSRLGLRLFNFDVIRENGKDGQYYVIDINYFPGYGKVPKYEAMFTDFLLSIARKRECK